MAFPYVLLAIALVAALGRGLLNALIAIAIVNVSFYARGVRAAAMVVRHMAFIEAARALGAQRPAHSGKRRGAQHRAATAGVRHAQYRRR